jgi:hypothetical protein
MWQHYSHWTPAAHRWIAEGVVEELSALGLMGEGGQRLSRRD